MASYRYKLVPAQTVTSNWDEHPTAREQLEAFLQAEGEQGWIYLMDHLGGRGRQTVLVFRLVFVGFVVVGAVNTLDDVLDFSDAMVFSMAFPNLLGSLLLAPTVRAEVRQYWGRYRSGVMREPSPSTQV